MDDIFRISSNLITNFLEKTIEKKIKKKFGISSSVVINKLEIMNKNGTTSANISVQLSANTEDFLHNLNKFV